MIFECVAIFAIISAITVICAFRKDVKHAWLMVPLLFLPGANILSDFFAEPLSRILPLDYLPTYIVIDLLAAVVSGIMIGVMSMKIEGKTTKITYIIIGVLYNIVLASILFQGYYVEVASKIV